jgi:predicted Ser/Thr protein kinase
MDRVAGHQVLRSLGAGTTGRVYLVEVRGVRRALKILHADERGRRASRALRSEFDLLREMIHPNLVRVGDIGLTEEGRTWFTAEYVDGTSIEEAAAGLDRPALVAVVAQILRALEFVHRRGLVHFDLHGSNVRITPEGRVKLLDFGLAGRAGRPLRGVRGTWPFVAPEVLAGGTPDRRADLFSLGVLLARCLGVGEVDGPPDPFRLGEGDGDRLPPELRRVVPRLLEPNPERRYGRAREALRDLASAAGRMLPEETTETLRAHVQFAPFVGRRREVRIVPRMIRALEHPPEGRRGERLPRVVLLEGEAGVGKSRLLREWIHRVAPEGVRVVRARCREGREGAYDPVPELVAGLLDLPGDLPPGLLERHGAVLSRIVPEILAPEGPTPPEDRSRLLTDLSDLVLRLAEGRPGSAAPPRPIPAGGRGRPPRGGVPHRVPRGAHARPPRDGTERAAAGGGGHAAGGVDPRPPRSASGWAPFPAPAPSPCPGFAGRRWPSSSGPCSASRLRSASSRSSWSAPAGTPSSSRLSWSAWWRWGG